mgnify:CR=1 FL=1|jgi:hypothetical protein|tara:strand:+ start:279 stop:944 length:666 start_codon:yes stop_codon:yes gene_type:complete
MSVKLNLVCENPDISDQFEVIEEQTNKNTPSELFIKGPYMMAEGVNRNKRLYPREELEREVANYNETMIKPGRAMGELNHPTTADVDLERACHMVTELTQDGNIFYGKSKVLTTPCGQIVRALINDGVKVGMSSRALGSLEESADHNKVRNMKLVAIDCVADPSYPKAFVNGILESKQWVLADNGQYEEAYDQFEKSVGNLPRKDVDKYLLERIKNFINKI